MSLGGRCYQDTAYTENKACYLELFSDKILMSLGGECYQDTAYTEK